MLPSMPYQSILRKCTSLLLNGPDGYAGTTLWSELQSLHLSDRSLATGTPVQPASQQASSRMTAWWGAPRPTQQKGTDDRRRALISSDHHRHGWRWRTLLASGADVLSMPSLSTRGLSPMGLGQRTAKYEDEVMDSDFTGTARSV